MKTINDVIIFKSGVWNSQTFTDEDLESIVQAFNASGKAGRVPLKFGHNEEQAYTDGKPALGWVQSIWRKGGDLFAKFSDIPDTIYDIIQKGLFKFTSIELLINAEYSGKRFPYLLDAVALLGAEPPAVDGVSDLQKLALSRASFTYAKVLSFTAQTEPTTIKLSSYEEPEMDEKAIQAAIERGIKAAVEPLQTQIKEQGTQLATFTKENETLKTQLADSKKAADEAAKIAKGEKVKFAREAAEAVLEAGVRLKKILPAQRLQFAKLLRLDNDDAVLEVKIADVEALAQVKSDDAKKTLAGGKSAFSRSTTGDSSEGSEGDSTLDADAEDAKVIEDYAAACSEVSTRTGLSNFASMQEVLRTKPQLAKRALKLITKTDDDAA